MKETIERAEWWGVLYIRLWWSLTLSIGVLVVVGMLGLMDPETTTNAILRAFTLYLPVQLCLMISVAQLGASFLQWLYLVIWGVIAAPVVYGWVHASIVILRKTHLYMRAGG